MYTAQLGTRVLGMDSSIADLDMPKPAILSTGLYALRGRHQGQLQRYDEKGIGVSSHAPLKCSMGRKARTQRHFVPCFTY